MQKQQIKDLLAAFDKKRVLVLGDLMLDHYIWGSVDRISPEAPVPVVNVKKEEYRLGGAANVVYNIKSLGGEPFVVGICGTDTYGSVMKNLLETRQISVAGLIESDRPTTLKTRVVAHSQQIVRVDRENATDVDPSLEERLIDRITNLVPYVDAVLIEDYNKGLLTPAIIEHTIKLATKHNKIVTVDPKFKNFFAYTGATVFKPNFNELQKNLGREIDTEEQFEQAGAELLERINSKWLLITRGEKGLSIFDHEGKHAKIPTYAQEVFDVSGAGDTVIATLTLALTAGADIISAAKIANHAAGMVCGKVGIYPATPQDILDSWAYHAN